ncbi:MAG: hypothetical protein C4K47_04060 [Candidatus Thorarchaeota archaeon]|nr:MAG: hypothetical protein C4K47_04060 [Candidatus Thorarchaeota archaeon]
MDILLQALLLIVFAVGVGTLASMLGIGGGIILMPLLVIVFGFSARLAPATTLVAALFAAIAGSYAYLRQKPSPVIVKAGLFLAATSVPGSLVGVWLRLIIPTDFILRLVFAVVLLPIAIRMLFAKRKGKGDLASEVGSFGFSQVSHRRLLSSLAGSFSAGTLSGLLGIGGGILMVPVFNMMMGLPMHAAVATSMLTMIFTATSGTMLNFLTSEIDFFYSLTLSIGMVIGAQIGPKLICHVNAIRLKQAFGVVLVYPLVNMAQLGKMMLDPSGTNPIMATIGDLIIWFLIVVPAIFVKVVESRRARTLETPSEKCEVPTSE